MSTHANKISNNRNKALDIRQKQSISISTPAFQLVDNRPLALAQRRLKEQVNKSPQVLQAAQWQAKANQHSSPNNLPIQRKPNQTGLPDKLKAGIENLSGQSMDDVKVHYNSAKPAQLQAHAYAQGSEIHLASGQEKHLPHEAWHVVQQKQDRVKPTMQLQRVAINDDQQLEQEATVMGTKAVHMSNSADQNVTSSTIQSKAAYNSTVQRVVTVAGHPFNTREAVPEGLTAALEALGAEGTEIEASLAKFRKWASAPAADDREWQESRGYAVVPRRGYSQDRVYPDVESLARALLGQHRSSANLKEENALARHTISNAHVQAGLNTLLQKLKSYFSTGGAGAGSEDQKTLETRRGRYQPQYEEGIWGTKGNPNHTALEALFTVPHTTVMNAAALFSDIAYMLIRSPLNKPVEKPAMPGSDARAGHWNVNEHDAWVQMARAKNARLSAGPSATAYWSLVMARRIGASPAEMEALAWGLFAFWNKGMMIRMMAGTHRYHEVFAVAAAFGVPYAPWQLSAPPGHAPEPVHEDAGDAGGTAAGPVASETATKTTSDPAEKQKEERKPDGDGDG